MKRNKLAGIAANRSLTMAILVGEGVAVLLTGLLSALLANLVLKGATGEGQSGVWVFVIRAVSVLLGCLAGVWIGKDKYLMIIGIIALGYLALLIALCIILYDGAFGGITAGLASVLVGGILGLMPKLLPARKGKYSTKYRR